MAIDFPNSPTTGDTHTVNGRTWTYDGTGWVVYGPSIDATVLRIDSGNNRVGINNSSPTVTLDVTGDTKVSGNLAVGSNTDVEASITSLEAGATATSIKVYADATARNTAVPSPAAGDLSFLTSTASVEVYDGSAWVSVGGATMITKVERFTASGTWTVPSGVTYATAHLRGGGAGFAHSNSALGGTGGTSSVAFASGTVSATGGKGTRFYGNNPYWYAQSAQPNSGKGAHAGYDHGQAPHGTEIVAGSDVTAGASITVTVGAGGTAGTSGAAGGSGYVWIEYQQEA